MGTEQEVLEPLIWFLSFILSSGIIIRAYYLMWKQQKYRTVLFFFLMFIFLLGISAVLSIISVVLYLLIGTVGLFFPLGCALWYRYKIKTRLNDHNIKPTHRYDAKKEYSKQESKPATELPKKNSIVEEVIPRETIHIIEDVTPCETAKVVEEVISHDKVDDVVNVTYPKETMCKPIDVGSIIQFSYANGRGDLSYRTVEIEKIESDRFHGFDVDKRATRTFLFERMGMEVVDDDLKIICHKDVLFSDDTPSSAYSVVIPKKQETKPKSKSRPSRDSMSVCFSGFKKADKEPLIELAEDNDFRVVGSVSRITDYLIIDSNSKKVGPRKLEKARDYGVTIITDEDFKDLIEYGVVPDGL